MVAWSYLITAICVIGSIGVGLLVVFAMISSKRHQVFGVLTALFVAVAVANTLTLTESPLQEFYVRLVMAITSFGLYVLYIFVLLTVRETRSWSAMLRETAWLAVATLFVTILDFTPLVFSTVQAASPPRPVPGIGVVLYISQYVLLGVLSILELARGIRRRPRSRHSRQQLILVLIGLVAIVVIGPITGFVLPLLFDQWQYIVLTPIYTLFFVCCIGYAIARHGLFDIRMAAVRTVAYILTLGVMTGIYFGLVYLVYLTLLGNVTISGVVGPINVLLALVLALLFQPIKRLFDRITNRIFYRGRYSVDDLIASVGEVVTSTANLRQLLADTAETISQTIKAAGASFVVYRGDRPYLQVGTQSFASLGGTTLGDDLKRYVIENGDGIIDIDEQIGRESKRPAVVSALSRLGVALVEPLVERDNLIGFLLVDEQKGGGYTRRDIRALQTLTDELSLAIQNASSLQEVRDLNTTLEKRVEVATRELTKSNEVLKALDETKDEFISMASHQLRTPLTSIKGYISMVLDGDAGAVSEQQRKLLQEAFVSSERMVHLIGDFLNVSRLQTGKFIVDRQPTDLAKLVDEEVESMRSIAESHEMLLVAKIAKNIPTLNVDGDKIRQVIMNFIDNAVFYSRPHSTIVVKLMRKGGDIMLEVHDQGIGVPAEVQKKLFTKFFRADNARRQRPDGTGVGLFLAKKVIMAQSGRMIFESTEGRGSVFGFCLPIHASR